MLQHTTCKPYLRLWHSDRCIRSSAVDKRLCDICSVPSLGIAPAMVKRQKKITTLPVEQADNPRSSRSLSLVAWLSNTCVQLLYRCMYGAFQGEVAVLDVTCLTEVACHITYSCKCCYHFHSVHNYRCRLFFFLNCHRVVTGLQLCWVGKHFKQWRSTMLGGSVGGMLPQGNFEESSFLAI